MNFEINGTVADAGVSFPKGFKAAGVAAGLKKSGALDLALIFSEAPAVAAGAFTTSKFQAAPVVHDAKILKANKPVRAVLVNSGNANASTGERGMRDAEESAKLAASALELEPDEVLVASTGRIGVPLPMDLVSGGIASAVAGLTHNGGPAASEAIMTTDTRPKRRETTLEINGKEVRIGGMVKGAGMIAPKMSVPHATMLAFITTDAAIAPDFLSSSLKTAVEHSFNRITVDGDMSTNDTVLVLANAEAGNETLTSESSEAAKFVDALTRISRDLAMDIVLDAEGATKFVVVRVSGTASEKDARLCAEAVANSLLCKTAWFGGDPNWGRVLAAAGYSDANFAAGDVSLHYDDSPVVINGEDAGTSEAELEKVLAKDSFTVSLKLGAGECSFEMWTNDISYEYVKINADYHT
ncbi:MAG: bifunctional glutamate N-acetyltransferase/amino-acid acetyltransferase ArgJ [Victivallales bacterium]|nr:bifunctional glutamate N-acetyltransferase/amino-acid acetyltransferase ArgJ [Victivallales bacterium]